MQIPILAGALVDGLTGKSVSVYGWHWPTSHPLEVVQFAAWGLFFVALTYGISSYFYTVVGAGLSRRFVWDLRMKLSEKVTAMSLSTHHRHGSGDLLDRVLRDTDRLREFPDQVLIRTCTNVLRAGYPIAMLFLMSPYLAMLALLVIPPQWMLTWYLQRRLYRVNSQSLSCQAELTTSMKETLDGMETLQTLQAEKETVRRFEHQGLGVEDQEMKGNRITGMIRGSIWLMTTLGIALVWWQGSILVLDGLLTIGTLIAFVGFAELAYRPFRFFTNTVKSYQQGLASLTRIHDLIAYPSTIEEMEPAPSLKLGAGRVELENVTFSYGADPVLHEIDLTFEPAQMTAIVGRSGSGKSSLLRLLPRLYDPEAGEVKIDGQNVREVSLASLRAQIGVVTQSPILLSGTLADNLRLGKPEATEDEMKRACESAGAWEFIESLEHQFTTRVGHEGIRLSGGQAQRLALARALLRNPRILLLDEPTSALDAESQGIIVDTLRRLAERVTVILVGHRLETICWADQIVVMEQGQILDQGTHEELLARSRTYNELFPSLEGVDVTNQTPVAV